MKPNPDELPGGLKSIAESEGLVFLTNAPPNTAPYPIACSKLPIFENAGEIDLLPVQMNFHAVVLDMDRESERSEYEKIMTYFFSGYGMRIVHIERIFVIKKSNRSTSRKNGFKARKIRRVFIEYYAPYRLLNVNKEQPE